jgi:3-deoxy-D-manno-octulosonate 8-phosphate phosphatase (KDO 8-P phosphatase)
MKPELKRKLAGVRLFLCDVDGVLTDGTVLMGNGVETKRFSIVDGLGLRLLQKAGSKVEAVAALLDRIGTGWESVCFVGDDIVDLGVLRRVGVAVGVANAIDEVTEVAHYVTEREGGRGAVREVVDLILKAQDRWAAMIKEHSQ